MMAASEGARMVVTRNHIASADRLSAAPATDLVLDVDRELRRASRAKPSETSR